MLTTTGNGQPNSFSVKVERKAKCLGKKTDEMANVTSGGIQAKTLISLFGVTV